MTRKPVIQLIASIVVSCLALNTAFAASAAGSIPISSNQTLARTSYGMFQDQAFTPALREVRLPITPRENIRQRWVEISLYSAAVGLVLVLHHARVNPNVDLMILAAASTVPGIKSKKQFAMESLTQLSEESLEEKNHGSTLRHTFWSKAIRDASGDGSLQVLSLAEISVLSQLLKTDGTNKQLGLDLTLSARTVDNHLVHAKAKLKSPVAKEEPFPVALLMKLSTIIDPADDTQKNMVQLIVSAALSDLSTLNRAEREFMFYVLRWTGRFAEMAAALSISKDTAYGYLSSVRRKLTVVGAASKRQEDEDPHRRWLMTIKILDLAKSRKQQGGRKEAIKLAEAVLNAGHDSIQSLGFSDLDVIMAILDIGADYETIAKSLEKKYSTVKTQMSKLFMTLERLRESQGMSAGQTAAVYGPRDVMPMRFQRGAAKKRLKALALQVQELLQGPAKELRYPWSEKEAQLVADLKSPEGPTRILRADRLYAKASLPDMKETMQYYLDNRFLILKEAGDPMKIPITNLYVPKEILKELKTNDIRSIQGVLAKREVFERNAGRLKSASAIVALVLGPIDSALQERKLASTVITPSRDGNSLSAPVAKPPPVLTPASSESNEELVWKIFVIQKSISRSKPLLDFEEKLFDIIRRHPVSPNILASALHLSEKSLHGILQNMYAKLIEHFEGFVLLPVDPGVIETLRRLRQVDHRLWNTLSHNEQTMIKNMIEGKAVSKISGQFIRLDKNLKRRLRKPPVPRAVAGNSEVQESFMPEQSEENILVVPVSETVHRRMSHQISLPSYITRGGPKKTNSRRVSVAA